MFGNKKVSMSKGRVKLSEDKITKLIDEMLKSKVPIKFAPNSDEYFMVDEEKGISLCLEQSKVKVANHNFLYHVPLQLAFVESQKKKLASVLEERTQALKKSLFKNEIDLLDKITKLYVKE
jgi:hypothetical protein